LSTQFFLSTKEETKQKIRTLTLQQETNVSIFLLHSPWSWIFSCISPCTQTCASIRCRCATSPLTSKRRYYSNLSTFTLIGFEMEKRIESSFVLVLETEEIESRSGSYICNFDSVVWMCGWVEIRDRVGCFQMGKYIMAKGMFIFPDLCCWVCAKW